MFLPVSLAQSLSIVHPGGYLARQQVTRKRIPREMVMKGLYGLCNAMFGLHGFRNADGCSFCSGRKQCLYSVGEVVYVEFFVADGKRASTGFSHH
jgi:hypothetical protein